MTTRRTRRKLRDLAQAAHWITTVDHHRRALQRHMIAMQEEAAHLLRNALWGEITSEEDAARDCWRRRDVRRYLSEAKHYRLILADPDKLRANMRGE